jgi:diadenosine tetraphosphate (Ap4A) HIT family hydrolase
MKKECYFCGEDTSQESENKLYRNDHLQCMMERNLSIEQIGELRAKLNETK